MRQRLSMTERFAARCRDSFAVRSLDYGAEGVKLDGGHGRGGGLEKERFWNGAGTALERSPPTLSSTGGQSRGTGAAAACSWAGAFHPETPSRAATTGNLFRYDATSGQYQFNWSTKGLTAGTYELRIDLGDGVTHTVRLGLK